MNSLEAQRRYENDPIFRTFVDVMRQMIRDLQMTPTEIRQAAIYAALLEEDLRLREMIVDMSESIKQGTFFKAPTTEESEPNR